MHKLINIIFIALCAINTPAIACFDDKNLNELIAQPLNGALIYVWSPRVVYSVQNFEVVSRAAAVAGLRLIVLHDRRLQANDLPPAMQLSQALCSEQLIKRDAQRHFPTAFVIGSLGLHRHPIVGAMPPAAWESSIAQRLQP